MADGMHIFADGTVRIGEATTGEMRQQEVTVITLPSCTVTEGCHLPDDGHPADWCEVDQAMWDRSVFTPMPPAQDDTPA